ncbi:MAG: WbqC family protein [Acetivibrio ethanolgignens]
MLLSIHQPNYWPYPGLIGKIALSDKFMFLTKVQLDKSSWQNRNRIRIKEGWKYLAVPVISKGKEGQKIQDTLISNQTNWRNQHLNAIRFAYQKAPYYKRYETFIHDLYKKKWEYLAELDIYIMEYILNELAIETEVIYDKDLEIRGEKNELLINVCHQLEADKYMSNKGSENYVNIEKFNAEHIEHIYIDYKGVKYPQLFGDFEGSLSILDMLMNCGSEATREIILDKNNYYFSEWNKRL